MNTLAAASVGTSTATLNGTAVAQNATTNLSFDYGTSTSYGSNVGASPATATGTNSTNMSASLTGLKPGTKYFFRAKGVNVAGTETGAQMMFVTTNNVASLASLKLSTGTLSPVFSSATTAYRVTVPNTTTTITVTPTVATNSQATATVNSTAVTSGTPSAPVSLSPGANSIMVAVTAQDQVTVVNYTVTVVRTTPAPAVSTLAASSITSTSATLNGTIDANGTSTTAAFDYGTTTAYGTETAASPSAVTGSTATPISLPLINLLPGTLYHFRATGSNAGGISSGADAFFTTPNNVATLSNLVLSSGALTPTFTSSNPSYTQTDSGTNSVTVTPTVTLGSHATVQVNGNSVASGTSSSAIPLSAGNNSIQILVTAQDGITKKTYTVAINYTGSGQQPSRQVAESLPVGAAAAAGGTPSSPAGAGSVVPVKAQLTAPAANGSVLPSATVTLAWNAGRSVSEYWLSVGSTVGGTDLYDGTQGQALSQAVTLPTDGRDVYVTLHSLLNGTWQTNNYVFTAADTTKATLIAPADQSVLTAALTTFTWNAVPGAVSYWLRIGSTFGGTDLYDATAGLALLQNVTLPTDGRDLFVSLNTNINGQWLASDSTLIASGGVSPGTGSPTPSSVGAASPSPQPAANAPPAQPTPGASDSSNGATSSVAASPSLVPARLTSPGDQAALAGSPVTFTWDAGVGVTEYWLSVGSTVVASDLYNASQGTNRTVTIALPTDGSPLYITLSSLINGQWQSNEYFYQAALPP